MRAVVYTGAGGNEVVAVAERPDPQPHGDEVLVAPAFAGINPADLQQRDGQYPPPKGAPADIPGLEVAGTVVALGERVLDWKVGDRVMGLVSGGGLADRVVVPERQLCGVPANLDDRAAAAVPEGFITAHDAIRGQAGLRPGEVLLVSGASGGVGTAAVQVGLASGARVIGTSRSAEGRALIENLGAVAVHPTDTVEAVRDLSGGAGADVALELVGAPGFDAAVDSLALLGRIVIVGVAQGADVSVNLRALMGRRARLFATVLRARPTDEKATAVRSFAREMLPALASGAIAPVVDRAFPLDDVHAAFTHMEVGTKAGKVLLDVRGAR